MTDMTKAEIILKLRNAHETLDGLKADVTLNIDGPREHLPGIASDLRWNRTLNLIGECIDALKLNAGPMFLVQREVAALLRVSWRTLERWRLEGVGPKFRRLGRKKVIYAREDVMAYADSRTFTSTAKANAALKEEGR